MSMILDGSAGLTTPGVVNTAGETIATTLAVTGASTLTGAVTAATTLAVTGVTTLTGGLNAALPVLSGGTGVTTSTGTGNNVLSASPTFTDTPLSTTAASATNTTQIATTAFAYGTLSNSANGYTKLANGVIIQWGLMASSGDTSITTVTFPITFPTAFRSITGQQNGNAGSDLYGNGWKLTATSTSSVNIKNSTGGTNGWYWIAIGI